MSARDLALRAIVIKHVADVTDKAIKDRRADLASEMGNGDRVTVPAPDDSGVSLGKVWRTEPKGTAAVIDRAAFTAWMEQNYPDAVDTAYQTSGAWADVVAVLQEHAPHLLTTSTVVHDWAEKEVLTLTERARQACGPGGETGIPGVAYEPPGPGVVTVKLSDDGPAVIERLWREGRIDLTSGEVRALPAGESS